MSPGRVQKKRAARSQKGPNLTPLYVFVVVVGGAIAGASWYYGRPGMAKKARANADPAAPTQVADAEEFDPFAGVPDDPNDPNAKLGAANKTWRKATGLEAEDVWIEANKHADKGWELAVEAKRAKERDAYRTFQEKGKAAKEAFNKAIELTAEWELTLLEEYGERDPQVRRILRTRNEWVDQLLLFHKTTGR